MSGYQGFAYVYDELTDDISYQKRAAYFDGIIQSVTHQRGILLDLACGTGSLSEEFAKLGYDVIGADCSEDMLAVAMEKRVESGLDIIYLCQSMQDLDLYGTVDAAVCALDSLNHITELDELQKAMDKVSLFLHPDGVFVFDVNTAYKHQQVLGNQNFVYDYDDVYLVWKNTLLPQNTIQIDLDLFEKEGDHYFRTSESFQERAYTQQELEQVLKKAGLKIEAIYHEDSLQPPMETSQRLIYVTTKENQK